MARTYHPLSTELKARISASVKAFNKRNPGLIGFQKGHPSFWKHETRKMVSEKLKAMGHKPRKYKAENHPNWLGGKIDFLKRLAKKRDNFTCQECGFKDADIMQIDHIKPTSLYPELFEQIDNLITLCPNCHARKTIREKKSRIWRTGRTKVVLSGSSVTG